MEIISSKWRVDVGRGRFARYAYEGRNYEESTDVRLRVRGAPQTHRRVGVVLVAWMFFFVDNNISMQEMVMD